jgi:hypothetical protein
MNKSLDDFIITCESNIIYSDEIATEGIGANIANAFKNLLAAAKRILTKIVEWITGKWKKEIPKKLIDPETFKQELMKKSNGTGVLYSQISEHSFNDLAVSAFKGLSEFEDEIINKCALNYGNTMIKRLNNYAVPNQYYRFRYATDDTVNKDKEFDDINGDIIQNDLPRLMKMISEGLRSDKDTDKAFSGAMYDNKPMDQMVRVNNIIKNYSDQINKSKEIYPKLDKFLSDIKAAVAKMNSDLEALMPKLNANTSLTEKQRSDIYSSLSKTVTLANQCTNVGVASSEKWAAGITRCSNVYREWVEKYTRAAKKESQEEE